MSKVNEEVRQSSNTKHFIFDIPTIISNLSAGINPSPVNVIRHSQPGYEYESRNLFNSKKFKKISYKNRKRGDLIFYSNSNGVIIHIAIYLGNDKVIESWPNKVVVWPIKNSHRSRIAGVRRVFN
ncbi:MAG: NlpC/P60 family protein [Intestinibacter bartlettii]|uniref:C40 family peptidase n=1 Tax=Intestinibacter bartlettii TaxID=261299 RepID=UPI0039A14149